MLKKAFLCSVKKKWYLYIALILSTVSIVLLELLPPMVLKDIINNYLSEVNPNLSILLKLSIFYVLFLILSLLFDFIKQILLIVLGEEFTLTVRLQMANKLKTIPTSYFSNEDSGVLTSRFTSDVEQINSFFSNGIISMIIDMLKIIAILVAMFVYSIYLGLITLCAIPIIFVISFTFKRLMFNAQKKSRVMIGLVNNQISETLKNERMIKIYSKEDYLIKKNNDCLDVNYKAQVKVSFFDAIYSPLIQIITALVIVIVVITTNASSIMAISIGTIALAIEYITSLFSPIENVGMEIQSIQKSLSGMARVKEFLNAPNMDKKLDVNDCGFINNKLSLEFDNVLFAYKKDKNVLNDISFMLDSESKISISGRTGVGKTTMFKLIEGEIKPTSGDVRINGVSTYLLPDEIKHKIFGYVSQSYYPLTRESIYNNISMKNDNITKDDVINSLKVVGIYDKISSYKDGIDTIYSDISFSYGENQLLNIARAIASNPRILLLDEMTSGLDSMTEKLIVDALEKASIGRMILQISHRLSTTFNSEKIIYIENGKIKNILPPKEFIKEEWAKNALLMEKSWNSN